MVLVPDPGSPATLLDEEPAIAQDLPVTGKAIVGRSLSQIAWSRLKRDRVAMAGGVVVVFLIIVAIIAPLIIGLFGHPPNEFHQKLINADTQLPEARFGGMSRDYLFGIE